MNVKVSIGDQVFLNEASEPFGAVRHVRPHELVIDIEGFGDITIAGQAVRAVHDGKIILDLNALPSGVRRAIRHAHDAETE